MLFGVMSLLMGHWIVFVAKICVKSSALNKRFYPCVAKSDIKNTQNYQVSDSNYFNHSLVRELIDSGDRNYCPQVFILKPQKLIYSNSYVNYDMWYAIS